MPKSFRHLTNLGFIRKVATQKHIHTYVYTKWHSKANIFKFKVHSVEQIKRPDISYVTLRQWGPLMVALWLRCCDTIRKVAGTIPDGFIGFFIDIILLIALWPWVRLSL
jgi:hypothetical protein